LTSGDGMQLVQGMRATSRTVLKRLLQAGTRCVHRMGDLDTSIPAWETMTGLPPDRMKITWQWADCSDLIPGTMKVGTLHRRMQPPCTQPPELVLRAWPLPHPALAARGLLQMQPKDNDGWWQSIYITNFNTPLDRILVNGQQMSRTEWQYYTWSGPLPTGLRVRDCQRKDHAREAALLGASVLPHYVDGSANCPLPLQLDIYAENGQHVTAYVNSLATYADLGVQFA
jgi:hypothetical protein